jgi:glycosyltransferase involved in cell wall biosynthesis
MAGIPAGRTVVVDGLALGAMPELAEREARRVRLVALVHHPLAFESGLEPETAAQLRQSETRTLAAAERVITTSPSTARELTGFGVPAERIRVVIPGTDPASPATGSAGPPLELLSVATLTPRKGHRVLVEALAGLRDLSWRLCCVGSTTRDPDTTEALRDQIVASGLEARITLTGELDDTALQACYREADAFVLASQHEGYGMVLTEAIAHGLPVVATRAGAIPETLPASAGLLVPSGDPRALEAALRRLIEDADLRSRLKKGALAARRNLPTWEQAGAQFAATLAEIDGQ